MTPHNPASASADRPRPESSRRSHMGVALVVVAVLAAVAIDVPAGSGGSAPTLLPTPAQACTIQWSPPEPLVTARGHTVLVDAPELAPWGSRWAMVGRLALEADSLGRVVGIPGAPEGYLRAGFVLRDDDVVQPLPAPGTSAFASPRVAAVSPDRALAVWGRPGVSETLVDEVWSAEYDGSSWSNVQRVIDSTQLSWSPTYHSGLLVAGNELRLVAGRTGFLSDSGAVLLRWRDGRWTTVPLRMPSISYVQAAVLPGDTMLVAYVHAAPPHGNTLFARRFDVDGNALGEPIRVSAPDAGVVYDLRIVAVGDSAVFIVWPGWASESGGGPAGLQLQPMYIARSVDQGRSWAVHRGPLVDLRQPSALTAMADARGAVHISTRIHVGSVSRPGHLTWWSQSWHVSEPPLVPDAVLVGAPVVIPLGRDSLRMIWQSDRLSDRVGGVVSTPGVMLSSRGAMTCVGAGESR